MQWIIINIYHILIILPFKHGKPSTHFGIDLKLLLFKPKNFYMISKNKFNKFIWVFFVLKIL